MWLSQNAPALLNRRLSYLLVFTSWDPNRDGVRQLFSITAFFCHKKSVRGSVTICYISWLFLLETTSRARGGQLSHSLTCDCHKKLLRCWIAGCPIFSSLLRETPTGMELGSYSLLDFLLSQEARARISHRLLHLHFVTSWGSNRGGVWQLSPIRADMDTRSSCVAQSQVVVSPRHFFLRP